MSNIEITPIDLGSVVIQDGVFNDDVLNFAAPGTVANGTVLARVGANLVAYNPAGADGSEIPRAVITYDVTATAIGVVPVRALKSGVVDLNRLIVEGGAVTQATIDGLQDVGIVVLDSTDSSVLDNA